MPPHAFSGDRADCRTRNDCEVDRGDFHGSYRMVKIDSRICRAIVRYQWNAMLRSVTDRLLLLRRIASRTRLADSNERAPALRKKSRKPEALAREERDYGLARMRLGLPRNALRDLFGNALRSGSR
jgi:hypothetical protein